METIFSIDQIPKKVPLFITIGNFDGIHIGHRHLLSFFKKQAKKHQAKTLLITFDQHTKLAKNKNAYLTTKAEKEAILNDLGVDIILNLKFDIFKQKPYQGFLDLLIKTLEKDFKGFISSKKLCIGYQRKGNTKKIKSYLKENVNNIMIHFLSSIRKRGKRISSSHLRLLLEKGKIKKANTLLANPFSIKEKVIKGKQLGRHIGFPTMNLPYPKDKVKLKEGVYLTKIFLEGKHYPSMTFIGRPFNTKENQVIIENHLLNFNKVKYNIFIKVEFISFLRKNKKIKDEKKLKNILENDKKKLIRFLKKESKK